MRNVNGNRCNERLEDNWQRGVAVSLFILESPYRSLLRLCQNRRVNAERGTLLTVLLPNSFQRMLQHLLPSAALLYNGLVSNLAVIVTTVPFHLPANAESDGRDALQFATYTVFTSVSQPIRAPRSIGT